MNITETSVFDLIIEARLATLTLTRTSLSTATISWSVPSDAKVYAGAIVLLSETPMDPSTFPTDGVQYTASTDWQMPASKIGSAQVVAAYYAQFGGDLTTNLVNVTGLTNDKQYYASLHICSNVLQYHTVGAHSYPLDNSFGAEAYLDTTGAIKRDIAPPINPNLGDVYYNIVDGKVYMWNGASWILAVADTVPTGTEFPTENLQAGQFF